ncbi:MAG: hypothetical protein ABI446_13245 [Gemmatimonadaceae bacterium]
MKTTKAALTALTLGAITLGGASLEAQQAATRSPKIERKGDKPAIVLVHGAREDDASWQHVIALLEKAGYTVIAVQNQLASLADDIATTTWAIALQKGPVIASSFLLPDEEMCGISFTARRSAIPY